MTSIKYVKGDLFAHIMESPTPIMLPHVCNCKGGFGSGFVVPLKKHFPIVETRYRGMFPSLQDKMGYTQFVKIHDNLTVANMVAQTLGGKRPLSYPALVACMKEVTEHLITMITDYNDPDKFPTIHAPMFGSALAGGNWSFIEELIKDIWCANEVPVTIYWREDNMPESIRCVVCRGTGQDEWVGVDGYRQPITCELCKGTGIYEKTT